MADREWVVIVPRVDRVAAPLSDAIDRLATHPTLGELAAGLREAAAWPTDLAAHRRLGLGTSGPLVLASGGVAFLPLPDAAKAPRYLEAIGLTGPTRRVGQMLVAAPKTFSLSSKLHSDPLADCPRKRGDADLFVLARMAGIGRVCVTALLDPGRVRIDARAVFAPAQPIAGWLGAPDDGLLQHLGPRLTTALTANLGPVARERLAKESGVTWLAGGVAVGAGPEPQTVTLAARLTDPKAARSAIDTLLAAQTRVQVAKADGGWSIRFEDREAHARIEGDALVVSTGAPTNGDHRAKLGGPGRLDAGLLRGATAAWYLRLTGMPHDGRAFVDAAGPVLASLGLRPDGLEGIASAVAFVTAHISELAVSVRVDGAALVAGLEVVTL